MNKKKKIYIRQKEKEFFEIFRGLHASIKKNIALAKHKNFIIKIKEVIK